jgi:hypothetical protein
VPGRDDERFEEYLKRFRPIAPLPLPIQRSGWASRRAVVMAALAGAAAVLVVATVMPRSRPEQNQSPQSESRPLGAEQLANSQPLTIRSAVSKSRNRFGGLAIPENNSPKGETKRIGRT